MIQLQVGFPAPRPFWPVGIDEGGVFVVDADGGLYVVLYMGDISKKESKAFSKGAIEARYVDGGEGLMLTLIRFKEVGLIFELSFDPNKGHKPLLGSDGSPLVTIMSIDTQRGGALCSLRTVTPPEKLLEMWRLRWNEPSTGTAQDDFLMRQYMDDIETLWSRATPAGVWGKA